MVPSLSRVLLPVACLAVFGCGGGDTDATSSSGDTTSSAPATPSLNGTSPSTAGPSSSSGTAPTTPDGAVRQAINALRGAQLGELWDLLPASYQQDVNGLVQAFGKGVDAEAWDKMMRTTSRYFTVIAAKRDMIAQSTGGKGSLMDMIGSSAEASAPPEMGPGVGQVLAMMPALASSADPVKMAEHEKKIDLAMHDATLALLGSEFGSAQGLSTFDGRKFFAGGASTFVKKLKEALAEGFRMVSSLGLIPPDTDLDKLLGDVTVTLGSTQGDNATVMVGMQGQQVPIEMTRVEGKWIPTGMAQAWKTEMAGMLEQVPKMQLEFVGMKPKIMEVTAKADPLLTKLQDAKTQIEFDIAYREVELTLKTPLAAATGLAGLAPAGAGGVSPATIVVDRKLSGTEIKAISIALEAASDSPSEAIVIVTSASGETKFELSPVADVKKLAAALSFGSVGDVNLLAKQIRVSVPVAATNDPAPEAGAPTTNDK